MIPLYTEQEFKLSIGTDLLPFECVACGKTFFRRKDQISRVLRKQAGRTNKYCNSKCLGIQRTIDNPKIEFKCANCNKTCHTPMANFKKSKNHFCNRSCAATYNNRHKKFGIRRSKLEKWLEQQLPALYPSFEFHWARKDAINSELDIYIPSLKLAFELNGIFHYEPIFGAEQLTKIQNNDQRKHAACYEAGIEMCWIDTSSFGYFKPEGAKKYLDIITSIIERRIATSK